VAGVDAEVAIVGGGVVGCALAHALARHGVRALLLEAESELARGASGANSGILHTGFDSTPGELETRLIVRAGELRETLLDELAVPVWHCGARLRPRDDDEREAVARLAAGAEQGGVPVCREHGGALSIPGEAVTDPVAFTAALAEAARRGGATIRLGARVERLAAGARGGMELELEGGERVRARAAVNCAGLHADELARTAGDRLVDVYPRKGEFLVFAAPAEEPLQEILLPVPSAMGKGVLVFPTVDRLAVIAGPTARERQDKRDWSVEPDAAEPILARATAMHPALAELEPLGAYAGLRPAGRGANYAIERSPTGAGLMHVAAIRSTGLSASLAIGEHVAGMLADAGLVALGPVRTLALPERDSTRPYWWERAIGRSQPAGAGSQPAAQPTDAR
jgi:glycerol-3-phosphate dehydrogenase